jgi:hypothetical protein
MEHEYVGSPKFVSIQLWVYGIFSGGDRRLGHHKNADSFRIHGEPSSASRGI